MSKETFDFSEALRRMRQGKMVKRKIMSEGFGAYIEKDELGNEYLMYGDYNSGYKPTKPHPVSYLTDEALLATDWEEVGG